MGRARRNAGASLVSHRPEQDGGEFVSRSEAEHEPSRPAAPAGSDRTAARAGRRPRPRAWLPAVGILTGLVVLAAVLLVAGPVRTIAGPADPPILLRWWLLTPLLYLAERFEVPLRFERIAFMYSSRELVLTAGLFLAAPVELVLSAGVAVLVHCLVRQWNEPLKVAFNTGEVVLTTSLLLVVFHALGPGPGVVEVGSILAAWTAVGVVAVTGASLISGLMRLLGDRLEPRRLALQVAYLLVAGFTNASLALVTVALLQQLPSIAWLALVPLAAVLLASKAYVSSRREQRATASLYQAARVLTETQDLDQALDRLAELMRDMFHVEQAEVVLFATGDTPAVRACAGGPALDLDARRSRSAPPDVRTQPPRGRPVEDAGPVDDGPGDTEGPDAPQDPQPQVSTGPDGSEVLSLELTSKAGTVNGCLAMTGRPAGAPAFDEMDQRLLATLGSQVAAWLRTGRLERSVAQLVAAEEALREQAYTDSLTGLANRARLVQRLDQLLAGGRGGFAVAFIDLDDFKVVNDRLGHATGDDLLATIARRLRSAVRGDDTVARMGGDEFALVLEDITGPEYGWRVGETVLARLSQPFEVHGYTIEVTASIGVVFVSPGSELDRDTVLRNADFAMYRAKQEGKRRVQAYEAGMEVQIVRRAQLSSDLDHALDRGELEVVYQPVVALGTLQVTGLEALARWHHPTLGLISPVEFIPIAEDRGLIGKVGRWVLDTAVIQAVNWNGERASGQRLRMGVNLSPLQLEQPDLTEQVRAVLAERGLAADALVLEVTETALVREQGLDALRGLLDLGALISLDDFGTGFSSLSHLGRLPLSSLKVPREFVAQMGTRTRSADLCAAVVRLAHSLGLAVVAEGVEQTSQLTALQRLGAEYAQGYLLSRPLSAHTATRMLAEPQRPLLDPASLARADP